MEGDKGITETRGAEENVTKIEQKKRRRKKDARVSSLNSLFLSPARIMPTSSLYISLMSASFRSCIYNDCTVLKSSVTPFLGPPLNDDSRA